MKLCEIFVPSLYNVRFGHVLGKELFVHIQFEQGSVKY